MFHDHSYLLFLLDVHYNIYVRIKNKEYFSKIFTIIGNLLEFVCIRT